MTDFNFFLPISKVEKQKDGTCIVSGYASSPTRDLDGEIVSLDAIKKAWPSYWEYRNIREMHQPKAVGVGKEANIDDFGPFLRAKIIDPDAVQKCLEEVYKGFSIGGRKLAKSGDTITDLELIEISLVDRPANPDCRITVAKRAKDAKEAYLLKAAKPSRDPKSRALSKMAKAVNLISKAGPPAAHDGFSLPAKKLDSPAKDISPQEVHNPQPSPRDDATQNNKVAGDDGDGHVHDVNGDSGPPKKPKGGKTNPFAGLKGKKKKRAMKLAKRLSDFALSPPKRVEALGGDTERSGVEEECPPRPLSSSSPDLSDLIKSLLSNYEDSNMDPEVVSSGSEGLDLDTAVINIIKRGMEPTRTKRMQMAQGNLRKASKARKNAAGSVKECHAALSKRYMAKMSKAKKPNDNDEDDMAETEKVLKSLQKAYSALTTVKTFIKAADNQITKAASRSGQRGYEAADSAGDTPVESPRGTKDFSPGAMSRAGGTSAPPAYPGDGSPYPGKMAKYADRNGMVPAHVAELLAENSKLEAQTAILSRAPAGPRPYAFDMAKVYSQDENPVASRQKSEVLMAGVDPLALQSQDDSTRNKAAATVVGNMLLSGSAFGKSIVSPEFRGRAGLGGR